MEKGIALLSGGIDSPVAIHLLQDRMDIIAIHFHQLPLTDKKEVEKVKTLAKHLNVSKLYLVPFTPVLKAIVDKCPHRHYFVLSKILMFRAAEIVAQRENAHFLISGENLAQVSSQTLSNLASITQNVSLEIFRPLLTYNKQEIIDLAKKIGTYEISKGPEICNLLGPVNPATRTKPEVIANDLKSLDVKNLLEKSLKDTEIINL